MTRIFDFQANLLRRFGLFEDAEGRAHDVLRQIQEAFAASGYAVTLTPAWARRPLPPT